MLCSGILTKFWSVDCPCSGTCVTLPYGSLIVSPSSTYAKLFGTTPPFANVYAKGFSLFASACISAVFATALFIVWRCAATRLAFSSARLLAAPPINPVAKPATPPIAAPIGPPTASPDAAPDKVPPTVDNVSFPVALNVVPARFANCPAWSNPKAYAGTLFIFFLFILY